MPNAQNEMVVLTRGGINAKTVATTTIDTTENGTRVFIPIGFAIVCTAATAISVGCTLNLGTNSANFDNIASSYAASIIDTTQAAVSMLNGFPPAIPANTDIKLKITAGATGTAQTIRVDLLGYYV